MPLVKYKRVKRIDYWNLGREYLSGHGFEEIEPGVWRNESRQEDAYMDSEGTITGPHCVSFRGSMDSIKWQAAYTTHINGELRGLGSEIKDKLHFCDRPTCKKHHHKIDDRSEAITYLDRGCIKTLTSHKHIIDNKPIHLCSECHAVAMFILEKSNDAKGSSIL